MVEQNLKEVPEYGVSQYIGRQKPSGRFIKRWNGQTGRS